MIHAPFFADLTAIIRALLLIVAAYNLWWSAPWLWTLWRGRGWPLSLIKGAIALTSVGIVILQVLILSRMDDGATSGPASMAFMLLLAGQVCFTLAHHTGWANRLAQMGEAIALSEALMLESDEETTRLIDRHDTKLAAKIAAIKVRSDD